MDLIQKNLLSQIADLHEVPEGAYNIRANGESAGSNTTANIDIVTQPERRRNVIVNTENDSWAAHLAQVLLASSPKRPNSTTFSGAPTFGSNKWRA